MLHDIFNKIFCSKESFPNYGDPTGERGVPVGVSPHINDATTFFYNPAARGDFPIDLERALAAELLTVLSARFLALHEYGHIVNGHVDYLHSLRRGLRFDEIPQPEAEQLLSPLDSQTLEMDADCFATQFGLRLVLEARYTGEIFKLLERDKKEAIFLWGTAGHVFFRLFADQRPESPDWSKNTYPSFGTRIIGHKGLIATLLMSKFNESFKKEIGILGLSIEQVLRMGMPHFLWVEQAFREMHPEEFTKYGMRMYADTISDEEKQALSARTRHWAVLRPKLLPYAMDSLAPVQG